MPGEAGAAVLLQRQGGGCRIGAALDDTEGAAPPADGRQHGRALVRVLESTLKTSGAPMPFRGDIIVDLNGEAWRAYEFGAALAQVDRAVLGTHRTLLPVQSIGDIGAATVLAGLVVACQGVRTALRQWRHCPGTRHLGRRASRCDSSVSAERH